MTRYFGGVGARFADGADVAVDQGRAAGGSRRTFASASSDALTSFSNVSTYVLSAWRTNTVRTIVRRTVAAPDVLRRNLAGLRGVERAFTYGSYPRGEETPTSDVDLMIVGSPDVDELTDRVEAAEGELGRIINYTILTEVELAHRRKHRDRFVASVEAGPTLPVIEPTHG